MGDFDELEGHDPVAEEDAGKKSAKPEKKPEPEPEVKPKT